MAVQQPTVKTAQAFAKVLEQQETPHWDGKAHAACLAYLAEAFLTSDGKFDRKGFMANLNTDTQLLYASNAKKWLIDLGDIPKLVAETGGYE